MQMQEKKIKAFTVLELIVVLAIIGVISAVAIPNFASWGKERAVRNSAERIKDLVVSINSQVQRGLYGFGQFYVEASDSEIKFVTNGMLMNNLAKHISSTANWYTTSKRCKLDTGTGSTTFWDHYGTENKNAEVRSFEIDNIVVSIGENSAVCFSKDGTWFSGTGAFISGEEVMTGMYICGDKKSACPGKVDKFGNFDLDLLYELSWSRFGNVKLERWNNKGKEWVIQ